MLNMMEYCHYIYNRETTVIEIDGYELWVQYWLAVLAQKRHREVYSLLISQLEYINQPVEITSDVHDEDADAIDCQWAEVNIRSMTD